MLPISLHRLLVDRLRREDPEVLHSYAQSEKRLLCRDRDRGLNYLKDKIAAYVEGQDGIARDVVDRRRDPRHRAGDLRCGCGWKVAADNFKLRIEAEHVAAGELRGHLTRLADPSFWDDPEVRRRLLTSLPEYRLSKLQRALPPRFALEMIRDHVLDIPGATSFLHVIVHGRPSEPPSDPCRHSRWTVLAPASGRSTRT